MPRYVKRQPEYSSRFDYDLLLIYLTGKFSRLSIVITLVWGLEETLFKKKNNKFKKSQT